MPLTPKDLLEALNNRYATKVFDPSRKIDSETWQALEKSLILTPSSFGLQPWKFIVVQSAETRDRLREVSWGQSQVTDASHLIVFTARTDLTDQDIDSWIRCLSEVQGTSMENLAGYSGMIRSFSSKMTPGEKHAWNIRQVYIALGQLMTSAAVLEVDTCPLEGISTGGYDEILGLTGTGYATAVACAVGYRSSEDAYSKVKKARFPQDKMITKI